MNIAFYSMLSITIFIALALGIILVMRRSWSMATAKNFVQVVSPRLTEQHNAAEQQATAKLLDIIQLVRSSLKMTEDPVLQRQFECAALPQALARDTYFAARFGGPLLMLLLGSFSPYARILCMVGGAGVAYLAPAIVLGRLIKRHREKVRLAIPDAFRRGTAKQPPCHSP